MQVQHKARRHCNGHAGSVGGKAGQIDQNFRREMWVYQLAIVDKHPRSRGCRISGVNPSASSAEQSTHSGQVERQDIPQVHKHHYPTKRESAVLQGLSHHTQNKLHLPKKGVSVVPLVVGKSYHL